MAAIVAPIKEPANFISEWVYDFSLERLESCQESIANSRDKSVDHVHIEKMIYCKDFVDPGRINSICATIKETFGYEPTVVQLSGSGWKGCLRNVPLQNFPGDFDVDESNGQVVTVRRNENRTKGKARGPFAPILVLCGLLYRGNIGTIVRSAVQANAFERIIIIDGEEIKGGGRKGVRLLDKDITYYSMLNAPLIHIDRYRSIDEFFDQENETDEVYHRKERIKVATALTTKSLDVYSEKAMNRLRKDNFLVFLGAEGDGLPKRVLEMCSTETADSLDCHIQIPKYSASINVSCAFAVVATVMSLARRMTGGNNIV